MVSEDMTDESTSEDPVRLPSSTTQDGTTTGSIAVCGNGVVEGGEECDGIVLNGETCQSLGHVPGALGCSDNCAYDISGCTPPGMVVVPEGEFTMGSNKYANERPIRQVKVGTFYIDQTEVTVSDYAACVSVGVCSEPNPGESCNWLVVGRENHPVNCVDWNHAVSYCGWVDGGAKRQPTEAEWEKAARGTDARTYPWGGSPEPSCSHVVMEDAAAGGDGCGNGSTMEVGSKSPSGDSPYGAQDMSGNVWEWVADWYADSYDAGDTDNPTGPAKGTFRVLRGGPWGSIGPNVFRVAYRAITPPTASNEYSGFRCARTPPAAL